MLEEKEHNAKWFKLGFSEKPVFNIVKAQEAAKKCLINFKLGYDKLFYPDLAKHFHEKKFANVTGAFLGMDEACQHTLAGDDFYHLKLFALGVCTWWYGDPIVPTKILKSETIIEWLASLSDEERTLAQTWYARRALKAP